ncbi:CPBP family intramembrane glutamic endopeptidase [Blastococcus haudaquaticus]|uniref:CPBP family intramembrane glutamic endopeptidase n=1 Tax=Blastococcus haudaquaticus TaxID=1938745 RepID=UPI001F32E504|nr:CPBP family intramembrane glutamic endopeptidase [Blastococcus haudaquaticus]
MPDPQARPVPRPLPVLAVAVLLVVLLLWNNVVITRTPGHPASYPLVNALATAVLLAVARASGLSWDELGMARRRLRPGLRWGGAALALVAAGYAVALAVPALRPLLADDRSAGIDLGELAVRVLVRVPFGTVVWEEVAFRGVLVAALARMVPVRRAALIAAAAFGLWHIRPTLGGLAANELVADDLADGPARVGAVVLVCAGTAVAGLLFTWLRLRSGSLLAPVLLHLATNSLGTVAAAIAQR